MAYSNYSSRILHFTGGITKFRIQRNNIGTLPILIGSTGNDLGGGTLVARDLIFLEGNNRNQKTPTVAESALINGFNYNAIPSQGINKVCYLDKDAIEFSIDNPTSNPELKIYIGGNVSVFFVESE